jgi:putative ABC transport system permease protein
VKSLEKIEETKEEIRTILRHVRRVSPGAPDDFAINQREEVVNTFRNVQGVIAMIGLFITGLSLFVGGIGVMNIMLVSVVERTREIGIRKAVGAKRSMILLQFLIEAVVICMIGGIVGFVLSIPLSLLISQFLPVRISLLLLIIALSVSSVVGITSGFMPAYRASNLDPFEALRYE